MSLPNLLPATTAFIQRAPRMLIGGDWVEAADGQTMALHNPATGEVVAHLSLAGSADLDRALAAAARGFEGPRLKMSTAQCSLHAGPSMIRPGPAPAPANGRTCCGSSPT